MEGAAAASRLHAAFSTTAPRAEPRLPAPLRRRGHHHQRQRSRGGSGWNHVPPEPPGGPQPTDPWRSGGELLVRRPHHLLHHHQECRPDPWRSGGELVVRRPRHRLQHHQEGGRPRRVERPSSTASFRRCPSRTPTWCRPSGRGLAVRRPHHQRRRLGLTTTCSALRFECRRALRRRCRV